MARGLINPTGTHEDVGLIPGLTQWIKICITMSCGVGHRCALDPTLLWLWCRPGGYSSDSTPSLGTSICRRSGPRNSNNNNKKTKDKKKKKKK